MDLNCWYISMVFLENLAFTHIHIPSDMSFFQLYNWMQWILTQIEGSWDSSKFNIKIKSPLEKGVLTLIFLRWFSVIIQWISANFFKCHAWMNLRAESTRFNIDCIAFYGHWLMSLGAIVRQNGYNWMVKAAKRLVLLFKQNP